MPCNPYEIGDALKRDESLQNRIVRSLGNFTVALLAIRDRPEQLALAGTGTFVMIDGSHYILTARHVWERVLVHADHVGITLKAGITHRHGIPSRDFVPCGLPTACVWNEWGPDMILLRIPAERVPVIDVYRAFWNLSGRVSINGTVLEVLVLMGTPAELGKITDTHAELQITGMFLGPERVRRIGTFDYLDYQIDRKAGLPKHFGGVSGGGVWRVWLFCSHENDEIEWKFNFHGVAFYQLGIGENPTVIRCHGPRSVRAALRAVGRA